MFLYSWKYEPGKKYCMNNEKNLIVKSRKHGKTYIKKYVDVLKTNIVTLMI